MNKAYFQVDMTGLRCICIPNALMPNPLCPYHGDVETIANMDKEVLRKHREGQWESQRSWPQTCADYCTKDSEVFLRLQSETQLPPPDHMADACRYNWDPPAKLSWGTRLFLGISGACLGYLLLRLAAAVFLWWKFQ